MVFKLAESGRARWRTVIGAHRARLVTTRARFEYGVLNEREETAV